MKLNEITTRRGLELAEALDERLRAAFADETPRYLIQTAVHKKRGSGEVAVWAISYTFHPKKRGVKPEEDDHLQLVKILFPKTAMQFFAEKKVKVKMGDHFKYGPNREVQRTATDFVWEIWEDK